MTARARVAAFAFALLGLGYYVLIQAESVGEFRLFFAETLCMTGMPGLPQAEVRGLAREAGSAEQAVMTPVTPRAASAQPGNEIVTGLRNTAVIVNKTSTVYG